MAGLRSTVVDISTFHYLYRILATAGITMCLSRLSFIVVDTILLLGLLWYQVAGTAIVLIGLSSTSVVTIWRLLRLTHLEATAYCFLAMNSRPKLCNGAQAKIKIEGTSWYLYQPSGTIWHTNDDVRHAEMGERRTGEERKLYIDKRTQSLGVVLGEQMRRAPSSKRKHSNKNPKLDENCKQLLSHRSRGRAAHNGWHIMMIGGFGTRKH